MAQAITQLVHVIVLNLYEADGTTSIFSDFLEFAQGITPPEFPAVGETGDFVIAGTTHRCEVTFRASNFQIGGPGIRAQYRIDAKEIS